MSIPVSAEGKSITDVEILHYTKAICSEEVGRLAEKVEKEISFVKKRIEHLEMRLGKEFQSIKMALFQAKIAKIEDQMQIRQLQIQNIIFAQKFHFLYAKLQGLDQLIEGLRTHRHDFSYIIIQSNDASEKNGETTPPKLFC